MRTMSSRGDTATLSGGPTTLLGTSISANSLGGLARKSMIDTVSGCGSFCTTTLPSTNFTLASLADTAICAAAVLAALIDKATASPAHRHILASPNRCGESLALHRQANQGPAGSGAGFSPMTVACVRAMSCCEERV